MNELDNKWLTDIRNTMADYSEELPSDGWRALSASLNAKACPQISPKYGHSFGAYSIRRIAVAASFTAFFGVCCYMPSAYDALSIDLLTPITAESLPVDVEPVASGRVMLAMLSDEESSTVVPVSQASVETATTESVEEVADMPEEELNDKPTGDPLGQLAGASSSSNTNNHSMSSTGKTHDIHSSGNSHWAMGLHLSGNGTGGDSDSYIMYAGDIDAFDSKNDSVQQNIPLDTNERITDSDSHMSFSVGISFEKSLMERLSLVTGLVYTNLSSEVEVNNRDWKKQNLHYLGVPIGLKCDLFESGPWSIYGSGSAMLERCVKGVRDDEILSISKLQASLSATAGCQYRLFQHVGIYIEPGMRYYFDDKSGVPSLRSERPFSFNVQVGVRFNY